MKMKIPSLVLLLLSLSIRSESSAISSCLEGQRKPLTGFCHKFMQCRNNIWEEKQCSKFTHNFDLKTNTCRDAREVDCKNAPGVCAERGETMQVPGDCRTYFQCLEDGSIKMESCPWFQRYDITTKSCQWLYKVDCSKHDECSTNLKFPEKGSDKEYTACSNGKYVRKYCDNGEIFDFDKNTCLKKSNEKSQMIKEGCGSGTVEPIPGDCNKYYKCDNGKRVEVKCWFFERFNPETLGCDYMWNVDCNNGTQCRTGDKRPSGNCREYYQCEFGYWKRKECGTSIGLPMYFDQISENCMIVGSNCSSVQCSIEGLKEQLPTDCSKYQICHQGHFYIQSCGWMQKFDVKTKECKYIGVDCTFGQDRSNCADNSRLPIDGNCYSFKECVDGQLETKYCLYPLFRYDRTKRSCTFLSDCVTDCYENEVKAVAGKCNQFYVCHEGRYQLRSCPRNTIFDMVTFTCTDPIYATCDPSTA